MKKVFISSVMRGFEGERAAAKEAVELLRHHPVMAEQFGARPQSSQSACLEGVRSSDIYVGIFGERYGSRVASGRSPTEEEYREAEKRGMETLCFVTEGPKDSDQKAFLESIGAYEQGKAFAFYADPASLKDKIVQALNDLHSDAVKPRMKAAEAAEVLRSRFAPCHARNFSPSAPELRCAVIPNRREASFLTPSDLDSETLRSTLAQLAMFQGSPPLFAVPAGADYRDGADFLEVFQGDQHGQHGRRTLSVASDGQLTCSLTIEKPVKRGNMVFGLVSGMVIDERQLRAMLRTFLQVAGKFYSEALQFQSETQFWAWGEICGVSDKFFGIIPQPEPNSITMPSHQLPDPLPLIQQPQPISRAQLLDPVDLVDSIVAALARRFRAENAYYKPPA